MTRVGQCGGDQRENVLRQKWLGECSNGAERTRFGELFGSSVPVISCEET
jgi:hypothetical protein